MVRILNKLDKTQIKTNKIIRIRDNTSQIEQIWRILHFQMLLMSKQLHGRVIIGYTIQITSFPSGDRLGQIYPHDSYTLGMDCTQVGILKKTY